MCLCTLLIFAIVSLKSETFWTHQFKSDILRIIPNYERIGRGGEEGREERYKVPLGRWDEGRG